MVNNHAAEVNCHPHSGQLDFALKGLNQKKRCVKGAFFREQSTPATVFLKTIKRSPGKSI
jgi:hypothetical protein